MVKLSDYVFSFLAEKGIKHAFMLPGGGAMHLVDSLGRSPDIQYLCPRHEQAADHSSGSRQRSRNSYSSGRPPPLAGVNRNVLPIPWKNRFWATG